MVGVVLDAAISMGGFHDSSLNLENASYALVNCYVFFPFFSTDLRV